MNTTVDVRSPFAFETLTISSTALPLTAGTYDRSDGAPADWALVTVETDALRFRDDGAVPTASVGHKQAADSSFMVYGTRAIRQLRMIRVTTDATVMVTYGRQADV